MSKKNVTYFADVRIFLERTYFYPKYGFTLLMHATEAVFTY